MVAERWPGVATPRQDTRLADHQLLERRDSQERDGHKEKRDNVKEKRDGVMEKRDSHVVERRDSHVDRRDSLVESFREEVVRQSRERQTSLSKVASLEREHSFGKVTTEEEHFLIKSCRALLRVNLSWKNHLFSETGSGKLSALKKRKH